MTTRLRRSDVDQMLRAVDPADPSPTPPSALRSIREELIRSTSSEPVDAHDLVAAPVDPPPRRSRRRVAGVVSGALVLAAAAALIVGLAPRTPLQAGPAAPNAAAEEILRRSNPLAVGRSVDCMGQLVPASTLALPGGVENADTPESAALRAFIADDPFAGMGSVSGGNWIRIGTSGDPLVFGQRRGELGIGTVVTLARSGSGWKATGSGGCSTVVPGPAERTAGVDQATLHGRTLHLLWGNGRDLNGNVLTDRLVRVETAPDDAGLHVLIVIEHNPAAPSGGVAFGVGTESEATVTLPDGVDAPDVIIDDAGIPGQRVPVT